ncbi:MAG: glycosyltransferase family 4 protein [Acidobacteriaceae bacterium]|nr:glycosyltransferase family 4 protein [Acidobacteriaceae bacterium]
MRKIPKLRFKHGRVLLFSIGRVYGGGETYCVKLAKLLSSRYEVGAVVGHPKLAAELSKITNSLWSIEPRAAISRVRCYAESAHRLRSAIRQWNPDVVHLNGQGEMYLAGISALSGIPTITTRHVLFNEHIPTHKRWFVRQNLRFIRRIVCVSSVIREQLSPFTNANKLTVIPNWLDQAPCPEPYRPPREHSPFRILYVGRLVQSKGVSDLIEAVRQLDSVTLDIVGEGNDMQNLKRRAEKYPIQFHGFQRDCAPFYRAADLLVFPSYFEGQGQVPFEAMSHGTPCLVSDIEAVLETTGNGAAAEVFQCGNVDDLARKIEYLRTNRSRLEELSRAGYERVTTAFTVDAVREKYFRLFDEVMEQAA